MQRFTAFIILLLSRLPFSVLWIFSEIIYVLLLLTSYRKSIIRENLENAFPDLSKKNWGKIHRQFYRHFSIVLVEIIKSFSISKDEILKRIKIINPDLPYGHIKRGESIIVMASHQGNWEWQLLACSAYGFPIDAAYQKIENIVFDELMYNMRGRFGAQLIQDKNFVKKAFERRNITRGLAMVADQTPRKNNIDFWTAFLHQDTPFFTGAEKIAKRLNYPVFYIEMIRVKKGFYTLELKPLALPPYSDNRFFITEQYAQEIEKTIKAHPSDWLWSHRRWKHKRGV